MVHHRSWGCVSSEPVKTTQVAMNGNGISPEGTIARAGSRARSPSEHAHQQVAIRIRVDGTYILCRRCVIVPRTFIYAILSSISLHTDAIPFKITASLSPKFIFTLTFTQNQFSCTPLAWCTYCPCTCPPFSHLPTGS